MTSAHQIILFCLILTLAHAHGGPRHTCIHGQTKIDPEYIDVNHELDFEGRVLQTYQNIRIFFDFSCKYEASTLLTSLGFGFTTSEFRDYIQKVILPPVKNYWEAALKVIPATRNLTNQGRYYVCNGAIRVSEFYNSVGIDADLVLFVTTANDQTQNYVANAVPCVMSTNNGRPLIGRIVYNLAKVFPTTNKATIENDIMVTLHETTHVLGFSTILYNTYINPITNTPLTGHYFNKVVNGQTIKVLNLPPLTSRIRSYFNCPTAPGAYLENEGGIGSANIHFERRIFYNEYMTASTLEDFRISQFSLALLEGTGWYKVDYNMAEPMTWGKNKGCAFLDSPCINLTTMAPNFKEFCSPLRSIGCSWTGRGAGACGRSSVKISTLLSPILDYWRNKTVVNDAFADNCPAYDIFENLDCENELNQLEATLPNQESYGYGSKCFIGSLYKPGYTLSPNGYCFKYNCELQTNGSYIVQVKVGNTTANCTMPGKISVPGFGGKLYCPDPDAFCQQMSAEGYCRRSCSGRGTCVNKQCQCIDGWTNHDCSLMGYVDNCDRCAGKDPFRASCYGDTCACNPSNTTCMCQLGLLTGMNCPRTLLDKKTTSTSTNTLPNSFDGGSTETGIVFRTEQGTYTSRTPTIVLIMIALIVGTVLLTLAVYFGLKHGRRLLRARAVQKPSVLKVNSSPKNFKPPTQNNDSSNKEACIP